MPLIHSKRPAAFKKNVETELHHDKPLKQALAIAYREAGEKQHKAHGGEMCAHGGPVHCNMGCYAEGGKVKKEDALDKRVRQHDELQTKRGEKYGHEATGVHSASYSSGRDRGQSMAGDLVRYAPSHQKAEYMDSAKEMHKTHLGELKSMKGPHGNYADGGDVSKGFNGATGSAGIQSSIKNLTSKPKMMADGGEMEIEEHGEDEGEEELEHVLAEELLHAMEKKDKKGVAEAIEALVMQCMSKGEM